MVTNVRNGTGRDLDRELIEVLDAISAVSIRIAEKLYAEGDGKKMTKGGEHGKRRVIYTQRRTQEMW